MKRQVTTNGRRLIVAALLLMMSTSCAPRGEEASASSASEPAPAPRLADPGETALANTAHKKFPEDATFSNEKIGEVEGKKRVCGNVTSNRKQYKYIFSMEGGLYVNPDEASWKRNCIDSWDVGTGGAGPAT